MVELVVLSILKNIYVLFLFLNHFRITSIIYSRRVLIKNTMSKINRKVIMASELIKSKDKFRLPECQRNLDNDQVNKMLSYQTQYFKKYNEYFFPTPIVIGIVDNNYYVIDGQHRCECINYLYSIVCNMK